jgi:D-lactate dehydrogenase
MKKTRMAFFEIEDWEREYLSQSLNEYDVEYFKENLNPESAAKAKDAEIIGVFIYSKIDKKILSMLPNLKMIATMSTGFDHIDMKECEKMKITVCNVPFYGENTVAEHAFALILALSRKLFPSIERTKKGSFNLEGLQGFDLKGKTIGLIGTGHISAHVARMAYGFEMKIIGYDIFENKDLEKNYGLEYVELKKLLGNSDIISLHLPLNEKTKHMINKKNIGLMKKTAIIINTARGGLIETNALAKALESKKIAGAGLDVLEEENAIKEEKQLLSHNYDTEKLRTLIDNHVLLKMDNVIITPHNAFNSEEALERIMDTTIDNIEGFLNSKPIHVIKTGP